jgi:hypothetical protein
MMTFWPFGVAQDIYGHSGSVAVFSAPAASWALHHHPPEKRNGLSVFLHENHEKCPKHTIESVFNYLQHKLLDVSKPR